MKLGNDEAPHFAILTSSARGHLARVRYLVEECGISPNTTWTDCAGLSPLMAACMRGHLDVVRYLINEQHVDVDAASGLGGNTALMFSIGEGGWDLQLQFNSDEQWTSKVEVTVSPDTWSASLSKCKEKPSGSLDVARFLAHHAGAFVDARDTFGRTALMKAAARGFLGAVVLLLEACADVNLVCSAYGFSPILYASHFGQLDVVKHLADHVVGLSLEVQSKDGCTALQLALSGGHVEVSKYLANRFCELSLLAFGGLFSETSELSPQDREAYGALTCEAYDACAEIEQVWRAKREDERVAADAEADRHAAELVAAEITELESKKRSRTTKKQRYASRQIRPTQAPDVNSDRHPPAASLPTLSCSKHVHKSNSNAELLCKPELNYSFADVEDEQRCHKLRALEARNAELEALLEEARSECSQLREANAHAQKELEHVRDNCAWFAAELDKAKESTRVRNKTKSDPRPSGVGVSLPQHSLKCFPVLRDVEDWLCDNRDLLQVGSLVRIPVLALRWTHGDINYGMVFGHGDHAGLSILKLFDELQRGVKSPLEIQRPIDVVESKGMMFALSNRRLTALMMYQSLHRDRLVRPWCRICSSTSAKFIAAMNSKIEGLGVETRPGISQHLGRLLFGSP